MSFLLPALSHVANRVKWVVADVVDAVLDWWAPLHDFDLPEAGLVDWEAENEVFDVAELYAAMERHPAGKGRVS